MGIKEINKRLTLIEESLRPPEPMLFLIKDEQGNDKWVNIDGWIQYSEETKASHTKIRTGEPVNYADFDRYLDNMKRRCMEAYEE